MDYHWSFCGKRQEQVKKLIAGPRGVYICDQCVALCSDIIHDEFLGPPPPEPTPRHGGWVDRLRRMTIALPR